MMPWKLLKLLAKTQTGSCCDIFNILAIVPPVGLSKAELVSLSLLHLYSLYLEFVMK